MNEDLPLVGDLPACQEGEGELQTLTLPDVRFRDIQREQAHALAEVDVEAPIELGHAGEERLHRVPVSLGEVVPLRQRSLCGFIFKAKSPSSGLARVKIYTEKGVRHNGTGIFAGGFTRAFPHVPVEDDGRLHDAGLRENFIERIFVMQRWHALSSGRKSIASLMKFHERHKYLIMAHSPKSLRILGKMVAEGRKDSLDKLYESYIAQLTSGLQLIATVKKNTNVLHHIMGYFKKDLTAAEKTELLDIVESYHSGLVPLIVPITLLNHYVRKYQPEYLLNQVYLKPHPLELMLRNHV